MNEVFYSLQGEGIRAGTANVFVRFSGCNQTCKVETHGFDCDTEFASGRSVTLDELLDWVQTCQIQAVGEAPVGCRWLILTGGEPGLQVDKEFCDYFHKRGYKLAVETNGSIELPHCQETSDKVDIDLNMGCYYLDWITVSPKVAEHCIRQKFAHEVKYVRGYGQGIPKTVVQAYHHLISPAFKGNEIDPDALAWCIKLCLENPKWRLSVQQHKSWRVR